MSDHKKVDLALLRRYQEQGDEAARDELVRRAMPLVRSCARRYERRGEQLEDLVQAGCVGLVKAIERFDLESGVTFSTFAVPNITGEIKRHFRDSCWAVHVPRAMKELDARVHRTRERFEHERGRPATDEELARLLEVTVEEVQDAVRAGAAYRSRSLEGEAGEARIMLETLGQEEPGFDTVEDQLLVRDALATLTPRERRILFMRFHRDMYQREIAERIGVSQMQVSRLLRQALDKLAARAARPEREALVAG
ncbi:SigB/SigF/SigG family RNA polymerase sigma factor [Patulibacter brassicae]|uniref:SigB/SigF/SigG family RNA polymerase sigma factor n=1 Tax=Patulibacter brassicae TaxID=1705717 RepID=A0ABU4VIZ5_9ACTN|nr:SigB/SigF/SigG family RNA polymerase sigma factor [Patulibacter brassicae]MDX8151809.1 SigB/SigF/SigG family RNA polymerase sigma factor [Patulibacter brassicae]